MVYAANEIWEGNKMKLIMENWKKYLEEATGLETTWDPGEGKIIS